MIARVWTAHAERQKVGDYIAHLRDVVLPMVRELPGFLGARLLEREDGDQVEIVVITEWESLDHIRAFAGANIEQAVIAAEAKALLTTFDTKVRHYRIVIDSD